MRYKYLWAVILSIILVLFSTFTMLDALFFPKAYALVDNSQSNNLVQNEVQANDGGEIKDTQNIQDSQTAGDIGQVKQTDISVNDQDTVQESEPVITENSYKDDNISITIEKYEENGTVFYVADVQLKSVEYLKTAFANNTFGKNITQKTSTMAQSNNAIFAINGDYYGFRDNGLVIRNGTLYRDVSRGYPDNKALVIDAKGNMEIITEGEISGESLITSGIIQGFSFGPVLVQDGKAVNIKTQSVSQKANPRTAVGQISPLHYIFIVVDGRSNVSNGMTLEKLANEFVNRGCATAYNLDGGGSATMWFNGEVINNPCEGRSFGERKISDIIYIGY